ncbi:hypothetical protein [Sodalis praecaptivus]|nr:hypothetical protein [Sodalis praecaptivus]
MAMTISRVAVNVCNSGNHAYVGVASATPWRPVVGTLLAWRVHNRWI